MTWILIYIIGLVVTNVIVLALNREGSVEFLDVFKENDGYEASVVVFWPLVLTALLILVPLLGASVIWKRLLIAYSSTKFSVALTARLNEIVDYVRTKVKLLHQFFLND